MTFLVPMTDVEYEVFLSETIPMFAAEKVASGQWSQEESLALAQKSYDDLLPLGLTTPDNYLYTIQTAPGTGIGIVWIAAQTRASKRIAYVYELSIQPEHQRKGHAKRAMQALEVEVKILGLTGLALHVFGHNHAAQALYARLGYQPTNIHMFKTVLPADL
jgi:ribosomal protein S18 acetylase RimI-like enzyme